jgi:hypothetical protein
VATPGEMIVGRAAFFGSVNITPSMLQYSVQFKDFRFPHPVMKRKFDAVNESLS